MSKGKGGTSKPKSRKAEPPWAELRARDLVRIDVKIPRDLLHRMKLVRAVTGVPVSEWIRWQLRIATDVELARRPGALWLRPGSTVYKLHMNEAGEPVPVKYGVSDGGERVWCIEIIPEVMLHLGLSADAASLDPEMYQAGMLCDLTADEPGQVQMRQALVAARDVLPRSPYPYRSGLGSLNQAAFRERKRDEAHARGRHALLEYAKKNGEVQPIADAPTD